MRASTDERHTAKVPREPLAHALATLEAGGLTDDFDPAALPAEVERFIRRADRRELTTLLATVLLRLPER